MLRNINIFVSHIAPYGASQRCATSQLPGTHPSNELWVFCAKPSTILFQALRWIWQVARVTTWCKQVQDIDNSRGADGGKDYQPRSKQKVKVVVSKLARQVVNKLTSQADNFAQAMLNIKILAEAVKCLREDMKSLKRIHEDQGEDPPAKRHADTQELTASTSHLQTFPDGTHTVHDTDFRKLRR